MYGQRGKISSIVDTDREKDCAKCDQIRSRCNCDNAIVSAELVWDSIVSEIGRTGRDYLFELLTQNAIESVSCNQFVRI